MFKSLKKDPHSISEMRVDFQSFGVHNPKFDLKIGSILPPDRERSDAENPSKIKGFRAHPTCLRLLLVRCSGNKAVLRLF